MQICVLLLALALVAHCSDMMATKVVMEDDGSSVIRPQQDYCKTIVTPGPCDPVSCNTNCRKQVALNAAGTCSSDGCECTYCLEPPRN
ncbi:hypothetical protein GUJ93_ZPchr0011g27762 [Zizania palustris]|uniref:Uncharacterized protein n=1 Tax=Zizania palustris TaxID=103762 RepID=A0A8J5WL64_ZIZPA|nr:hypothetical protein GUJ93_ZPchr0011g27762 [Zizania palustris]